MPEPGWIETALATHEGRLLRYACRLLDGDAEAARDAVQDAFVRLCRADRAAVEPKLTPWLFTVVRNRCIDHLRQEGRMIPLSDASPATLAPPSPEPESAGADADASRALAARVAALPARSQEVLRLKFQDGLSYQEISAITGLSISHVGVVLHRTLAALRGRITPEATP